MYYERWIELRNGDVVVRRENQTELAEWVEVAPRVWERRMREW